MRILYIDISLRGHRTKYLEALAINNNSVLLLPERYETLPNKQYIMTSGYDKKRSFGTYMKWIREISNIVKKEGIDIVHFLCGDSLYRYFGFALESIHAKKVVTYHHMLFSKIRVISMKRIFSVTYGIVHTDALLEGLYKCRINNVIKIEYPVFMKEVAISNKEAKKKIGLPLDKPCIVIMGGTQKYKGLDILLDALVEVTAPFMLYITGVEREFNREYILEHTKTYSDSVMLHLERLSEKEYAETIAATDLIVLPYRREFDGASGPMIEGVWNRKYIIGASHGSMGETIQKHKLGSTFETENAHDLARVLNRVLLTVPSWDKEAETYRNELTVEKFVDRNAVLYNKLI